MKRFMLAVAVSAFAAGAAVSPARAKAKQSGAANDSFMTRCEREQG